MLSAPFTRLARAIQPAGFFQIKTRYLKNFLVFLKDESRGDLKKLFNQPLLPLRKKLLMVCGIGPETADSILLYAAGKPIFVVDAYTRRIFGRMGLISPDADYGEIQEFFMKFLPKNEAIFNEFHALIVEHAKRFCLKRPQCWVCPLRNSCNHYALLT